MIIIHFCLLLSFSFHSISITPFEFNLNLKQHPFPYFYCIFQSLLFWNIDCYCVYTTMSIKSAEIYIRKTGSFDDSEDNAQKEVHIVVCICLNYRYLLVDINTNFKSLQIVFFYPNIILSFWLLSLILFILVFHQDYLYYSQFP